MHISPPPSNQDKKVNLNTERGKLGGSCEEGIIFLTYAKLCFCTSPYLCLRSLGYCCPTFGGAIWNSLLTTALIADLNTNLYVAHNLNVDWSRSCFVDNCVDGCLGAEACVLGALRAFQEKEKK